MISYRKSTTPHVNVMTKIDWKAVSRDRHLSNLYIITVSNRFNALLNTEGDISISDKYDWVIEANKAVATEMLPKKSKKANDFNNRQISHAREVLTNISKKHHSCPTRNTYASLLRAKETLDNAYNETLDKFVKDKVQQMENLSQEQQHGAACQALR